MRGHQKYFALEDSEKKLLPNFLAVLNLEVDEAGAAVIRHGNERVLRARFNDARFFWDVDQKIPLVDRVEMLKSVTFQKDLGSYWDKTERNRAVARRIIDRFDPPLFDSEIKFNTFCAGVDQAALLAKADLTTEMVKEFTELQGVVGGLYARAQRLPDGVARAIHDHYKPASQEDTIPSLSAGSIIALADKMSSIVDMFAIGLQPTGSKDPFALRRAGNGVVRILVEDDKLNDRLHLSHVSRAAIENTKAAEDAALRSSIDEFLLDRFEFYLTRDGQGESAGGAGSSQSRHDGKRRCSRRPLDRLWKDCRICESAGCTGGLAECVGGGRTAEADRKHSASGEEKRRLFLPIRNRKALLREPAEKELSRQVTEVNQAIQRSYREGNYDAVIAAIASLQPPLNAFFDSVMVMVEDASLRDNRLALLSRTESVVRWAADFSELASI